MRKEEFTIGDYLHVYNRGNRKQPIVFDENDKKHFLECLYYFNADISIPNIFNELRKKNFKFNLKWPQDWPARKPLVTILAFVLMPNHFHLLLKEITDGGTAKFMQKLGTGLTNYFNEKYNESGSLFQGSYKAKRVATDSYLGYLSAYIQLKNPLELMSGGLAKAQNNFEEAFRWAVNYPYSSLNVYATNAPSPIIDKEILGELFPKADQYNDFCSDCITGMVLDDTLKDIVFEE